MAATTLTTFLLYEPLPIEPPDNAHSDPDDYHHKFGRSMCSDRGTTSKNRILCAEIDKPALVIGVAVIASRRLPVTDMTSMYQEAAKELSRWAGNIGIS